MRSKILSAVIYFSMACCFTKASAQTDTINKKPTYKIGIFAPLFLDSVFSENNFKYNTGLPRFIIPGVDFVQGALVALDSIHLENEKIEATIYDSKSYSKTIKWLIENKKLDSLHLIIGSVKEAEYKLLADFAGQKKIPFISTTYPNDGGISSNPFVVIINSTLKAHCDAIYSYLLQNHGTDKIFLCRQKGIQEDMVAGFFKQANEQEGKPLLNIRTLNFEDNLTTDYLKTQLDSNRKNIIIGTSLDETFATNIAVACHEIKSTYPITLIGMPNWDGMTGLYNKDDLTDLPIYITSPYYNNKGNDYSKMLIGAYANKYKGKPGDMAFKGFEMTFLFTRLMVKYPGKLMNNLNDKSVKIFCEYNFRPVLLKKENEKPDYFENKHLYFIKILNGAKSLAW